MQIQSTWKCILAIVVMHSFFYWNTAQSQEINRISTFDKTRALRPSLKPVGDNASLELAGQKELTPQRIKEIAPFAVSRIQNNLDKLFNDKMDEEKRDGAYSLNKNDIRQFPFTERPPVGETPAQEKYSFELSEGNIGAENIRMIGGRDPGQWKGFKLVDKSRTPEPETSWKAFDSPGDASADVNLAVSETNVVVTSHTTVGFYDRNGNKLKDPMWIGEFFDWVKPSTEVDNYFDARCIFDPYRKRFWIGVLGNSSKEKGDSVKRAHIFCCAVSKTQNPMDGFYTYYWYSGYEKTHGHDYPVFGISQDVVIETNTAIKDDGKRYNNICIFDANSLANGQFKPGWRFWGWKNPENDIVAQTHIQPLTHYGTSPYVYLVGKQDNNVIVWGIKNPLKANQSVSSWVLDFSNSPFSKATPAPQKGGAKDLWFENLSNWIFSATYRNGSLYFVMSDSKDWLQSGTKTTSVRVVRVRNVGSNYWCDINRVFGGNNKFDDQPSDKMWYGFPAIAVNAAGDMVMSYCRSGPSIYPQVRASAWRHDGNDILPSRLIKAGEAPYTIGLKWDTWPWGDCSGAVVDPKDEHSVWVATCYTTTAKNNNWGIWVAKINMW